MGGSSTRYPWAPEDPLNEGSSFVNPNFPGTHQQGRSRSRHLNGTQIAPTSSVPRFSEVSCCVFFARMGELFKHPVNIAIAIWVFLAIPECVIVMMNYTGALECSMGKQQAEKTAEICTQVVNALFVLTCLLVLPLLFRHTVQLCRWLTSDKTELRSFYCRGGTRKPHDRTHISIVVLFIQLTCWSRIAFSIIFWVYPLGSRPMGSATACFAISWVSPLLALVYMLLSPLNREYDVIQEGDEPMLRMYERSNAFMVEQRIMMPGQARWEGSIIPNCCSDYRVACWTCFLPCCMHGYNMERLGFGPKCMHIAAAIIITLGPIMVFTLSAKAMSAQGVPLVAGVLIGVAVSFCGLLSGGLWRMKMRQRYGLPGYWLEDLWCWLCCSLCSLCQEIRTADRYDVQESSLLRARSHIPQGMVSLVSLEEEDLPHSDDKVWVRPDLRPSRILPAGANVPRTYSNPLAPQYMEF